MSAAIAAAGISGISSLVGSILTNQANAKAQASANYANYQMMLQDENWEASQADITRQYDSAMFNAEAAYNTNAAHDQYNYDRQLAADQQQYNVENAAQQNAYQQSFMTQSMDFNSAQAQRQMDFQAAQAQLQRDYESQMSSTAYQRSVADMKAAGLNPILGVASGGASTPTVSAPSGAAGSVGMPSPSLPGAGLPSVGMANVSGLSAPTARAGMAHMQAPHFENVIGPAISTAMQVYRGTNEAQKIAADVANTNADTANKAAQGNLLAAQAGEVTARTDLATKQAGLTKNEADEIDARAAAQRSIPGLNAAQANAASASAAQSLQGASTAKAQEKQIEEVTSQYKNYGLPGYGGMVQPAILAGQTTERAIRQLQGGGLGTQTGPGTSAFRTPLSLPSDSQLGSDPNYVVPTP